MVVCSIVEYSSTTGNCGSLTIVTAVLVYNISSSIKVAGVNSSNSVVVVEVVVVVDVIAVVGGSNNNIVVK